MNLKIPIGIISDRNKKAMKCHHFLIFFLMAYIITTMIREKENAMKETYMNKSPMFPAKKIVFMLL